MLTQFVEFVEQIFPSITPYTKEEVKKSIKQFEHLGLHFKLCNSQPFELLTQGDIIDSIPFVRYDENGEQFAFRAKGILISNTCDAENDDVILFAPLIPIKSLSISRDNIIKNLNYRLLYIPDANLKDFVVDMGIINCYSTKLIVSNIEKGKIRKEQSLNRLGYYLFLCKLTVHLMRPEDTDAHSMRSAVVV